MKKLFIILITVLLLVTASGCKKKEEAPSETKTFTNGTITIELPKEFEEKTDADGLKYYDNGNVMIIAVSYLKSELPQFGYNEDLDLASFSNLLVKDIELLSRNEGETFNSYVYTGESGDNSYYYYLATYEGETSFASVYFICHADNQYSYSGQFPEWAGKVTVN